MITRLRRRRQETVLPDGERPRHVGVVMDGNRRWARAAGFADSGVGHRHGAEHLRDLLGWCEQFGVAALSVYLLSADNLRKRDDTEIANLIALVETTVVRAVADAGRWQLFVAGDLTLVPDSARSALDRAIRRTAGRPHELTLAIGYDGRADMVRALARAFGGDPSTRPDLDEIARHLDGGPSKRIDLVIRTGNEQRLSGFFPWQCADAEIFLSPRMWPAFTEADFADALAFYARARARRAS